MKKMNTLTGLREYSQAKADLETLKLITSKVSYLCSYCCDFGIFYDQERMEFEETRACYNSTTQTVRGIATGIIFDVEWDDNEEKVYLKVLCQGKVHHVLSTRVTMDVLCSFREASKRTANNWTENELESYEFLKGHPFFMKIIKGHLVFLEPLHPHLYEKVEAIAEKLYETDFDFLEA